MKFRFFGCSPDVPTEDAIKELCKFGQQVVKQMAERLKTYEKFSFSHLQKLHEIEKIKGHNPDKVHELRVGLPEGQFRLFFIIIIEENALILHIASKKKQKIEDDIELAKKRAAQLRNKK